MNQVQKNNNFNDEPSSMVEAVAKIMLLVTFVAVPMILIYPQISYISEKISLLTPLLRIITTLMSVLLILGYFTFLSWLFCSAIKKVVDHALETSSE